MEEGWFANGAEGAVRNLFRTHTNKLELQGCSATDVDPVAVSLWIRQ